MPKKRLPAALAKITGADVKNPQRFRGRATFNLPPLGPPPARLTAAEAKAWRIFARDMPWLRRSDRAMVELAAAIKAMIEGNPAAPLRLFTELRLCLAAMGGTPSDRTKMPPVPDDDDPDDPAAEFVN